MRLGRLKMSRSKRCARCGKDLSGGIYASVWNSEHGEIFYCHDDDGTCYVPATWAGYPELKGERRE